jgi:hypothetical protein
MHLSLEAHILDFGLAKVLDMQQGSKWWLSTHNVLGTYGYIAPNKHNCCMKCICSSDVGGFHMSVILAHPVAYYTSIESVHYGCVFFDVQRPDLA